MPRSQAAWQQARDVSQSLRSTTTSSKRRRDESDDDAAVAATPTEAKMTAQQQEQLQRLFVAVKNARGDFFSLFQVTNQKENVKHAQLSLQWYDGPLIEAMRGGDMFLIDEVSLADDAVLERLNSVLEPSRELLLAEKSGIDAERVVAHDAFRVLATMNPGGDYGKKELSPAMRNRFTEIWVPSNDTRCEQHPVVLKIIENNHIYNTERICCKF